jgi:hypothetical protein
MNLLNRLADGLGLTRLSTPSPPPPSPERA